MPVYMVIDALHDSNECLLYPHNRHLQHSCKASERVLEGIVINIPPVLLCWDDSLTPMITGTPDHLALSMARLPTAKIEDREE